MNSLTYENILTSKYIWMCVYTHTDHTPHSIKEKTAEFEFIGKGIKTA